MLFNVEGRGAELAEIAGMAAGLGSEALVGGW